MIAIRDAVRDDVARLTQIYNALVLTTTIAWTETERTVEEGLSVFDRASDSGGPCLVAEDTNTGEVVGYAAYGPFRGAGVWPGYRFTAEHSVHVDQRYWRRDVGRALLEALIGRARAAGVHVLVGAIDGANEASIRFHERLGFVEVGRMPEIGYKFGRWLDLVFMQLVLDGPHPASSR